MEMIISEKTSYQLIYNACSPNPDSKNENLNLFMQSLGDDFLTRIQKEAVENLSNFQMSNLSNSQVANLNVKQEIFDTNQQEYDGTMTNNYQRNFPNQNSVAVKQNQQGDGEI